MKRIVLTLILSAFTLGVFAQIQNEDLAIVQSYFQKDKKDLVKQNIKMSDVQAQAFWPIYDEYEAKRLKLSNERVAIINDYLKQFSTLTGQQASDLAYRTFSSDKAFTDLQKSYFKKFQTAIGGVNAAKFYQLENYLTEIVRMRVQDEIPFIGELKKKARK